MWRAYQMKEARREIFAGDLDPDRAETLLVRWCDRYPNSSCKKAADGVLVSAEGRHHQSRGGKLVINDGVAASGHIAQP